MTTMGTTKLKDCEGCGGTGVLTRDVAHYGEHDTEDASCERCNGSGDEPALELCGCDESQLYRALLARAAEWNVPGLGYEDPALMAEIKAALALRP